MNTEKESFNLKKDIDTILLNLKIISQIKENDKLITSNSMLEIDTTYFQFAKRWFNNDSRISTIEYIKSIVDATLEITDTTLSEENKLKSKNIFEEDNSHLLQRFLLEMTNACKGLDNLKITYSNDISIVSAIEISKEKLLMRMEGIQKILKINVNKDTKDKH